MAIENTIADFFVGLGIEVDPQIIKVGLKKINDAVAQVEKAAVKMGAAVEAAAATSVVAVEQIASKFEDLYFASQRIGASVENVQAFGFAISQVGGTAQGARSALEGLGSFMRNNPGGESWIQRLGVQTRDATGGFRDTKEILDDLAGRLRLMPFYMARVRAQMLGIDDATLMAMRRGTDQFSADYKRLARLYGLNQEQGSEAAHAVMTRVRDMQMRFSLLFSKIALDLVNVVAPPLDRFVAWFDRNAPQIERRLEGVVQRVFVVGGAIVEMSAKGVKWLTELDRATRGWSTAIIGAAVAWKVFNLSFLATSTGATIAGIVAIGLAITGLVDDVRTYLAGGKSLIDWRPVIDGANATYRAIVGVLNRFLEFIEPITSAFSDLWSGLGSAFNKAGPQIANGFKGVLQPLKEIWDAWSPYMVKTLQEWGEKWMQFAGLLVRAAAVIVRAFGPAVLDGVKTILQGLVDVLKLLGDTLRVVADLLTGHWGQAWRDAKSVAVDAIKEIVHAATGLQKTLIDLWTAANPAIPHQLPPGHALAIPNQGDAIAKPTGAPSAHRSGLASLWDALARGPTSWVGVSAQAPQTSAQQRALAVQAMSYFQSQGWSKAQAAGIAANLVAESGVGINKVGDFGTAYGIAQWHPNRQADFRAWSGHSIVGSSLQEQLAFVQFELTRGLRRAAGDSLRRMSSASAAGNLVSNDYEVPLDIWGSKAAARGALADQLFASTNAVPRGAGTTVNQDNKTTIHVQGSDAKATASATADAQDRVNGNLLRYAKGAMS